MKKIFVTIMTLAAAVFQMQAIEDASFSIQLESDNNRTSVVTLNQAAIYTANEQNASEMLAQITNTTTAVNIYAIAPYGNMSIMGTNSLIGTYIGFTTNSRTNYSLTFGGVSGSQLYLIDHGVSPVHVEPIVENGVYDFTAAASSTINNRFEINYAYVNMKGNFDNPTGEWNWVGQFSYDGSVFTKEVTLAANTWYNFFMDINGTEMHNNSEFSRGDAPKGGFPAAEGTNCWMHSDAPGVYTFTWNHATQELTVTYPTIVVKGAMTSDGTDVVLTPAYDGSTATGTIDFAGQANEWYTFGVQLNGTWIGDNAGFTRADNSRTISGDQNMWFEIEDGTVDYVYTFTWTFATNTLTIGYPDAAPVPTCTTVRTSMVVDNYYTICLPKAVESANGASFWNMSNRGDGVAYIVEAELPLVAGRPYIIQAEAEELCVEYSGDNAAAGAFGALHGTLAPMDQAALDAAGTDIYLLKNNELRLVSGRSDNNLPANRAYIKYSELVVSTPSPAPGRRVRAIPMQNQGTTGVENINASEAPVKTVIDGTMYIIRGEHMFDATGRMVK